MKKISVFVLALVLALFYFDFGVYALSMPEKIRVALTTRCSEVEEIAISNNQLLIGMESNGLLNGFTLVYSNSGFKVTYSNLFYIKLQYSFNSYEQALSQADVYKMTNLPAFPCLEGENLWTVCIGGYQSEQAASANQSLLGSASTVMSSNRFILMRSGSENTIGFDLGTKYPQFKDPTGSISIGDRKYRGEIEIGRFSGKKVTAVSVVTMNEYLYGTVPSEMPSAWHLEALKAQTVAARTYAASKIGSHSEFGADLCDNIHCQVYIGAGHEKESTNTAVDQTTGVVAVYGGNLITASFYSSSGGYTANSEDVWVTALPYLRSVPDTYEMTAKEWTRNFTLGELTNAVTAAGKNIGQVIGVDLITDSSSGRVMEIIFSGTYETVSFKKEDIKAVFSTLPGGSLESRMFTITNGSVTRAPVQVYVTNGINQSQIEFNQVYAAGSGGVLSSIAQSVNNPVTLTSNGLISSYSMYTESISVNSGVIAFVGRGWGHGVGLSQYGAKGMAESGFNYEQILKHYYQGIDLIVLQ